MVGTFSPFPSSILPIFFMPKIGCDSLERKGCKDGAVRMSWRYLYSMLSETASFVGSNEWIASAIEIPAISKSRRAFPVGAVSNRTYRQTLENTQFSAAQSILGS